MSDGATRAHSARPARSIISWVCLVIAALLVPLSVVATWASERLVQESVFVETFAPLSADESVQAAVIEQTTALIESAIDIDGLTESVFDGIGELGLPDRAASALDLLRGPAAAGVRDVLESAIGDFVRSELFSNAWSGALHLSHRTLVATVEGSSAGGALQVDDAGAISLELGPIIDEARTALVNSGFEFAESIPAFDSLDASIPIAQSDALPMVRAVYGTATTLGWWLPIIALVLLILSVVVAVRRPAGVMRAGIAVAIGALGLLIALTIAGGALNGVADGSGFSRDATAAIYEQIVSGMRGASWMLIILGVLVALVGGWRMWASRSARSQRECPDGVAAISTGSSAA